MKKTIILSLLSVSISAAGYATPLTGSLIDQRIAFRAPVSSEKKISTDYNVRITLVDIYGNPVSGGTGLRGFWARNEATGEYYYPGGQEDEDKFEGLPAGTYTFGAYPGAWEGAVQKTVTLSNPEVGPDGYVVVQLTYWVE